MHLFVRQTGWMQVLPGGHKSTARQPLASFGPLPAVAAANTSTTADTIAVPEQQQVSTEFATPVTSDTPSPRRRRRPRRPNEAAARKPAAKPSKNPSVPKYELFQQPSASVASPARNVVTLPPAALSDPNEALNRHTRRASRSGAPANSSITEQQPQVPAEFEPYALSFQQVAQQLAAKQQQSASTADVQASPAAHAEATWSSNSRARWDNKHRKGNKQRNTGKALELFGITTDPSITSDSNVSSATAMTATKVNMEAPDTLAQQPSQSRLAAQRLASLLMQQQQQRKLQQQQDAEPDQQQQDLQQHSSSRQRPARIILPSMPQQGTTRLYMPAPSVNETTSAADRQPLRLLSVRQQQQMRQEARQQAIQKLRQKAVQDYQATLDQTLNWQGSGQYTYHPAAPRFLPVALQRSWIPSNASSSSSGGQPAAGEEQLPAAAAAAAQLSQSDIAAVKAINQVVTKQLGTTAALPDRAYKGERGLYIASLSPQAIADRLRRWSSCCGPAYTAQLIKREPCLLGLEPQTLLKTLEALNKTLQLPTQACVEFVSKNVVVVGLDSDELRARVQGLIDAVGLGWDDAVELAQKQPQLLMVHPSHIKGQMTALAKLLPEAAPKLPQAVKRSPFLILKSPRAIARSIQELADSLGLSTWATARLVAGQPSILSSNCDQLQKRLQRLQHLSSVSKRWQRELQALSPTMLARCLACSDATIERLALLKDVGAAGASRLPPVHLVLTMPDNHFQEMLADMAERNLKRQQQLEAAEAEELAAAIESRSQEAVGVTTGAGGAGSQHGETAGSVASRSRQQAAESSETGSSAPTTQTAVGRKLLQRLGLASTQQNGSIQLATTAAAEDASITGTDDGTGPDADADSISDRAVREGVLGGDAAWRSTLAGLKDALQQSVADLAGGNKKTSTKSSRSKTPGKT